MARLSKYTPDLLAPVVAECRSMGQVLDRLGLRRTGGNYRMIGQRIEAYALDTSHFKGQGWARGLTKEESPGLRRMARCHRLPDDEVFRLGSTYTPGKLGKRLRELGREYACAVCGLVDWQGQPLTLHVDHINGETSDNRLSNLRFLCPNCHQQTRTWGAKKQRR